MNTHKSPRPIKLSAVNFANISDAKLTADNFMFDERAISQMKFFAVALLTFTVNKTVKNFMLDKK